VTWKVSDLAGSEVIDETGQKIGILIDVLPSGANDVWVIRTDIVKSGEILLPALKEVIKKVDVTGKKITVALPAGLKEVFEG
jgi:16S rRNA processing protein RimM